MTDVVPGRDRALRVVTFGNSIPLLVVPPPRGRAERSFAEQVEDRLHDLGVRAHATNEGRLHDFAHRALDRYERDVRVHAPDVVVLAFGVLECQPWHGPTWLLQHLQRRTWWTTRLGRRYREQVARRLWRLVRAFRQYVVAPRTRAPWQVHPDRFARALGHLVRIVRTDLGALVVVLDVAPPGRPLQQRIPGQDRRVTRANAVIARIVDHGDAGVVRVRVDDLVAAHGGADATMPDGLHFTPTLHAAVAARIAAVVAAELDVEAAA